MTHSQIPVRGPHNGQRAVRAWRTEDPELRRMLATHMHCGEPMQLMVGGPALPNEGFAVRNDDGLRTYRCTCGFSFDQRQD